MTPVFRSELLKQRSTGSNLGLVGGMLGLVLLAALLHGLGLPAESVEGSSQQLTVVFGWGAKLGVLFAALVGALSITAEFRHGTIRPTLLATPRRGRVGAAKVAVGMLIGAGVGLIATTIAAVAGSAVLAARGIEVVVMPAEYALFVAGGAAAASLWAAVGVGVGAFVRDQVPTMIGICAWLLFVEGILAGDFLGALGEVTRWAPGAAAAAIAGLDPDALLAPLGGVLVLAAYAVAAAAAGWFALRHRDVA